MLEKSLYPNGPLLSRHAHIHSLCYMYHCIVLRILQALMYLKCKLFGEKECTACNQVRAGKLAQYQKSTDLLVQPKLPFQKTSRREEQTWEKQRNEKKKKTKPT